MIDLKISRRKFLQSAAALTAAPYFIPSTVLGKDGGVAPSNRIAMAQIGVGGQGSYHLNIQTKRKDLQIVAICDTDTRHLVRARKTIADAYGSDAGIEFRQDYRQLLENKHKFDAVLIATPDHSHAVITMDMLKNGKDCYTEKPLTRTIGEGRAVADTVSQYGRVLQTGSNSRSNSNVRYLADVVRNGYLGKVQRVEVSMPVTNHGPIPLQQPCDPPAELDYDLWLGPAPYNPYFLSQSTDPYYNMRYQRCHFWFRYQFDYATGEMSDRGAHLLDLVQLILDKDNTGPVKVSGTGQRDAAGDFDTFMAYEFDIHYGDGITVHGSSKGDDTTRGLTVFGDDGWINLHLESNVLTASNPKLLEILLKPSEPTIGRSPGHHENFYDCIRTRNEPVATAEIGHRSASVCHITTIAMLLKRPLEWDPAIERFIEDDEANTYLSRTYRSPWRL